MTGYAAFGTQLQIGDGATTEAFTTIAQVQSISGPEFTFDVIDLTHHEAPGAWEIIAPTILRSGEVSIDLLFDPAEPTHADVAGGLLNDMLAKTLRNFKLIFPDNANTEWDFSAYVISFSPDMPHDDALTASVTLKPAGQPTLA